MVSYVLIWIRSPFAFLSGQMTHVPISGPVAQLMERISFNPNIFRRNAVLFHNGLDLAGQTFFKRIRTVCPFLLDNMSSLVYRHIAMLKKIQIIEKTYGGTDEAAKALGITPRHLRRVKNGNSSSETLKILIKRIYNDIRKAA